MRNYPQPKKPKLLNLNLPFIIILALLLNTFQLAKINAQEVEINLDGLYAPANLWRIEDVLNVQIMNSNVSDFDIKRSIPSII